MTLTLIPDLEASAGTWLRDHPAIVTLDARVSGAIPKSFTRPWVKIVQLQATPEPNTTVEHLIVYLLQLDCYAGDTPNTGQAQANLLARTVRAALHEWSGNTDLTVTAVRTTGDARIPDETFDPWRERRILTVQIWAHAN